MLSFLSACVHLDPIAIIQTGGYIGIALLIFAESGLLVGLFFPGDSLLFAAGLLAGDGTLSFLPLASVVIIAALLGDSVGYWFGANVGASFFTRKDSRIFKQAYVVRTQDFYATYGARAVVLARFVPIVRTIAPILAGIGTMTYGRFMAYNVIGAALWAGGMVSLGFFLGAALPQSSQYVLPLSLSIIVISFSPVAIHLIRSRQKTRPS